MCIILVENITEPIMFIYPNKVKNITGYSK